MSVSVLSVQERIETAAQACQQSLAADSLASSVGRLGMLAEPEAAFRLLSQITADPRSRVGMAKLCASIPGDAGQSEIERTLLLLASLHSLPQVPGLAVSDRVKDLFADEFRFFADPPANWKPSFRVDDVRFWEMARIATLRRFPAGQYHWQISGFPRSWLTQVRQPWRVLAHLIREIGGFGPVFELHLNDRRKNRVILLEKESHFSYYRAARSMEKQPSIRGLMTESWMFCESTGRVSPHLAWMTKTPLSAGALFADLGVAPMDSGFLVGSEERRRSYDIGRYRPRNICVLWPRKHLLAWADQHPEFDQ